jgi:exodeoxyribonuclease VII large subunit
MREERTEALMGRLEALDPRHTLERGYAMVRSSSGDILTGTEKMQAGDEIRLIMKDGTADAQVLRTGTEKEQ